jgi:hypothetical protein
MIKAVFRVTMPDELLQPFMQMIRDFDMQHDPGHESKVHVETLIENDWPADKMEKILRAITPSPAHMYVKKAVAMDAPEIERLRSENDHLRGILAYSSLPCIFCSLPAAEMGKCLHGFPGCARADDMMSAPEMMPEATE